jgi:transcriptional regulator with GAF, ATPase, and Fis domain
MVDRLVRSSQAPSCAAIASSRCAPSLAEVETLRERLQSENEYLRAGVSSAEGFEDIIGKSPALRSVLFQVEHVAPADSAVLLLGETGTGKELIAKAIHARSRRSDRTLV